MDLYRQHTLKIRNVQNYLIQTSRTFRAKKKNTTALIIYTKTHGGRVSSGSVNTIRLTELLTPQAMERQSTQKDAGQEAQLATLPAAPAPLLLRPWGCPHSSHTPVLDKERCALRACGACPGPKTWVLTGATHSCSSFTGPDSRVPAGDSAH